MSAQEIQKFSQRFKASDLPGAAVHPDVVVSGVPESPSCNTSSESQDPNTQRDVISSKISSSTLSILKGSLSSGLAQEEEGGLRDTRAGNDEVDGGVAQFTASPNLNTTRCQTNFLFEHETNQEHVKQTLTMT